MTINMITVTADEFDPFIGQKFTVTTETGDVELVLDNVKRFDKSDVRDSHLEIDGVVYPPRKPFALTLTGPRKPALEPSTVTLSHEILGQLDLFISPFRQDQNEMLYESVFN